MSRRPEVAGPPILPHDALQRAAQTGEAALARGRGLLVAGRVGTGRSTLIRELARRRRVRGFTVIEASSSEFISGQSFIGQLEGRLQELLEIASLAPVIWSVPSFSDLVWAGRHQTLELARRWAAPDQAGANAPGRPMAPHFRPSLRGVT